MTYLGKLAGVVVLCLAVGIVVTGCKDESPAPAPVPPASSTSPSPTPDAQATTQTMCPVMGTPINKALFVDHEGQRVYFCCAKCVVEFKKDPEKYIAKLGGQGSAPAQPAEGGSEPK